MCAVLQQDIVRDRAREDEPQDQEQVSAKQNLLMYVVLEKIGLSSSESENIPLSVLAESIKKIQHSHRADRWRKF